MNQFILYFQRIDLFDCFYQVTNFGYAIQMHDTQHLAQHTGKMKIYHAKITAEYFIGHIIIFQDSSQTFYHQHTPCHIIFFTKSINFVYGRSSEFNTCLLELQIGGTPSIQQREHSPQTGTNAKTYQRGLYTVKSNIKISTVIRLCFQVINGDFIQKFFHTVGRHHIILATLFDSSKNQLCHSRKILTRYLLIYLFPTNTYGRLILQNITACPVMFLTLYHRHRKLLHFIPFHIRRTCIHISVR